LVTGMFSAQSMGAVSGLMIGVGLGLSGGLLTFLWFGGIDALQHLILRCILYFKQYLPWNISRFLDHCVELILLRRVGGSYIFPHRLLMEHFEEINERDAVAIKKPIRTGIKIVGGLGRFVTVLVVGLLISTQITSIVMNPFTICDYPPVRLIVMGPDPGFDIVNEITDIVYVRFMAPESICKKYLVQENIVKAEIDLTRMVEGEHLVPVQIITPSDIIVDLYGVDPEIVMVELVKSD